MRTAVTLLIVLGIAGGGTWFAYKRWPEKFAFLQAMIFHHLRNQMALGDFDLFVFRIA